MHTRCGPPSVLALELVGNDDYNILQSLPRVRYPHQPRLVQVGNGAQANGLLDPVAGGQKRKTTLGSRAIQALKVINKRALKQRTLILNES